MVYQLNPSACAQQLRQRGLRYSQLVQRRLVWNTPFKFSNKYANGAFGGWTLSQNFFARSGLPLTVLDATSGIGNYNGNTPFFPTEVIGPAHKVAVTSMDRAACPSNGFSSANNLTVFPNQIRNQFRGPGFFDSDFTINKNFKLTERMAFGVGANFYNVFNHPNFASPTDTWTGTGTSSGTFGQVFQTTAPPTGPYGSFFSGLPSGRIIQFQGKLVF